MNAPCGVCGGARFGYRMGWPGLYPDQPPNLRGKSLPVCGDLACDVAAVRRMIRAAGPAYPFPFHLTGGRIRPADVAPDTAPAPRPVAAGRPEQKSLI